MDGCRGKGTAFGSAALGKALIQAAEKLGLEIELPRLDQDRDRRILEDRPRDLLCLCQNPL